MSQKKKPKPEQIYNLFSLIFDCVETGRYQLTRHAAERLNERDIDLIDLEYVLKNGFHDKPKTKFDEAFETWKYAIQGKTLDSTSIRAIVSFDEEGLLIITVIRLGTK